VLARIRGRFSAEKDRYFLWSPALFAGGIFLYFSLKNEPAFYQPFLFVIIVSISCFLSRRISTAFYFLMAVAIFATGFFVAFSHASFSNSPVIKKDAGLVSIEATIESIEHMKKGLRIMLKDLDLEQTGKGKLPLEETPAKARINIRAKADFIKPGDRVSLAAILTPPPPHPSYPGAYDFSRFAYFEKIGATGYNIGKIKVINHAGLTDGFVEKIRNSVAENIFSNFANSPANGAMAAALITGHKHAIPQKILDDMRNSGLGHLLAISGLHMAMVMATSFFIIRAMLALFPYIALKYNIKKWAAFSALILGFFYLILSGFPVSAKRAYIMAGLFFLAITTDRISSPLRPLALAAIIIMIFDPVSVTGPGFQMSFAAVAALIMAYETVPYFRPQNMAKTSVTRKIGIYIAAILFSSLIAGIATTPFALYHFGRYTNYGLLANFVAIPVMTFWVMPCAVLALILMPFGLENLAFAPMGYGIDVITSYASYISALPYASGSVPHLESLAIVVFSLGALWLIIWKSKIRLAGLIIMALSLVMMVLPSSKPDIIIDGAGKLFAVRNATGKLVFSSLSPARYSRKEWLQYNGQEKAVSFKKAVFNDERGINLNCDDETCLYEAGSYKTLFIKKSTDINNYCDNADIIIDLSKTVQSCQNLENSRRLVYKISYADLRDNGTYVIWLEKPLKVKNVEDERGNRLWTAKNKF